MVIHFHHFSSLPGSEISLGKKNKTTGSKSSASDILSRLVLWQTRRWSAPRVFRQDLRPFLSEKKGWPICYSRTVLLLRIKANHSRQMRKNLWIRIHEKKTAKSLILWFASVSSLRLYQECKRDRKVVDPQTIWLDRGEMNDTMWHSNIKRQSRPCCLRPIYGGEVSQPSIIVGPEYGYYDWAWLRPHLPCHQTQILLFTSDEGMTGKNVSSCLCSTLTQTPKTHLHARTHTCINTYTRALGR